MEVKRLLLTLLLWLFKSFAIMIEAGLLFLAIFILIQATKICSFSMGVFSFFLLCGFFLIQEMKSEGEKSEWTISFRKSTGEFIFCCMVIAVITSFSFLIFKGDSDFRKRIERIKRKKEKISIKR